jgi:MFS family permease
MKNTFRSLKSYNYRIWASGALVSNIGTWMQRIGQDWLVLTHLTHNNATAVGTVMALQFGPQLVLLPLTGYAADHMDRRKLLFATQASMGTLALVLGLLTIGGWVQLWHVYVFALLLGCVTAFDAPIRQTFVSDLVGEENLSNAVALNSTSFNAARMIGPAIAGLLIAAVDCGWVFIINAMSFGAVLASLRLLRVHELRPQHKLRHSRAGLVEGFRYVWSRPDMRVILVMIFLVGTFCLNFAIFISTMAVTVFHSGAGRYGFLTSTLAIGTVTGALLAAHRAKPRFTLLPAAAGMFGLLLGVAAMAPNYWLFGMVLVGVGVAAQTLNTSTNSFMQLSADPPMRGRVVAIFLAVVMGGTPIGAPIVGWVADTFGPRWAIGVGAVAGVLAAMVGMRYLVTYRQLRLCITDGRVRLSINPASMTGDVAQPEQDAA